MLAFDKLVLDYLYFAAGGLHELENEKNRRNNRAPERETLKPGGSRD